MNDDRAFERATRDWLEAGSDRTPAATIDAVLLAVRTTPQERDLRIPWRTPKMSNPMRLAAAVAIVAVVGFAGLNLLGRGGIGATPTPSPTFNPTPSPLGTVTFSSRQYAYSVAIPASWNATPATQAWAGGDGIEQLDPPYADVFRPNAAPDWAVVRIKAQAVADGTTSAAWLTQWQARRAVGGTCFGDASVWMDATVAGLPARRYEWRCTGSPASDARANYDEYTFMTDGMGYVITGMPSMVAILVQSFPAR